MLKYFISNINKLYNHTTNFNRLIQLLQDLGSYQLAAAYLERREHFSRQVENSDVLFKVLCRQAYVYEYFRKSSEALAARAKALAAYEEMAGQSAFVAKDNFGLSGISDLALLYKAANRFADMEAPMRRIASKGKVAGLELIKLLRILAEIYEQQGRNLDQEQTLLQIVELSKSLVEMDRKIPILFEGIARIRLLLLYRSLNRAAEADRTFARLLQLDRELSSGADWSKTPHDAPYQMVRGLVFQSEGLSAEAAASFRKFLELKERQTGKDHPDFAAALDEVATSYAAMSDFDRALSYSRRAVEAAIASDLAFSGSRASFASIVGNL